jgi:hypothetical protein
MPRIRFAGLSILVVLLLMFGVASGRTGAATPTPTKTPSATQTPRPARTATPRATASPTTTATAAATPTESAASDADQFAFLRDEALSKPLIYGPSQGSLPMDQQNISFAAAHVTVRDCAVHLAFTNPVSASEHGWDYGLIFRAGNQHFYRLGVVSTTDWFVALDSGAPTQTGKVAGFNLSANGKNSLDLIAIGNRGYFGVNAQYVATLDLSANQASGDIAAASTFFTNSYIAGKSTSYDNFIIWSFDSGTATPAAGGSPTAAVSPTASAVAPTPAPTTVASPGATNSYTSPTYGYTLTWSSVWQENTRY